MESNVDHYVVAFGPEDDPLRGRQMVTTPRVTLTVPEGTVVSVKAVNTSGMESWDWARLVVR